MAIIYAGNIILLAVSPGVNLTTPVNLEHNRLSTLSQSFYDITENSSIRMSMDAIQHRLYDNGSDYIIENDKELMKIVISLSDPLW